MKAYLDLRNALKALFPDFRRKDANSSEDATHNFNRIMHKNIWQGLCCWCLRIIKLCIFLFCASAFISALLFAFRPETALAIITVIGAPIMILAALWLARYRILRSPGSLKVALPAVFFGAFIFRIAFAIGVSNYQVVDFQNAHDLAVAIVNGQGLSYTDNYTLKELSRWYNKTIDKPLPTAQLPPLTPVMLAAVYKASGQNNPMYGKIVNSILGAFTGVFLYLLIAPLSRRWAWASAILYALYPTSIVSTNLLCTEVPASCCLIGAAALLNNAFLNRKTMQWVLIACAGLFTGLTTLIRPATQVIISAAGSLLLSIRSFRKGLLQVSIFALFLILPLFTWGMRNYQKIGTFVYQPAEIGGNMLVMTNYISDPAAESSDSLWISYCNSSEEVEKHRLAGKVALKRILTNLHKPSFIVHIMNNQYWAWHIDGEMLKLVFWGRHGGANGNAFDTMNGIVEIFYIVVLLLAFLGALQGRALGLAESPGILMLMLFFIGTNLLMLIFRSDPRYHLLLMPAILILAGRALCGSGRD